MPSKVTTRITAEQATESNHPGFLFLSAHPDTETEPAILRDRTARTNEEALRLINEVERENGIPENEWCKRVELVECEFDDAEAVGETLKALVWVPVIE